MKKRLYKLGKIKEKALKLPTSYDALSPMEKADVRNRYVELQEGLCWYCKRTLRKGPAKKVRQMLLTGMIFPPDFFHHRVHLHHDHITGLTVGATHARCNAVLKVYHGE